jgi:phage shock protein E
MFSFLSKFFKKETIDYKALLQSGAVIIDVRTPSEFQQGHIRQSINIPLSEINKQLPKLKKQGKPIITCCRSGARSGNAASVLTNAGIVAYNGGPWNVLQQML